MSRPSSRPQRTCKKPIALSTAANSYNIEYDPQQLDAARMAKVQLQQPDQWGGSKNSELDQILNQTSTTPMPGYLDFNMQMLSEEPFMMGEYLTGTPTFDGYTSTKQQSVFDPALWADSIVPPSTFNNPHTNLDYFAIGNELEQIAAPADLLNEPASFTVSRSDDIALPYKVTDQPQDDTANGTLGKIPKKRGRKRKQLDADAQVVERKKFLERNRVAANRCRERKKTYVSNLESRSKDLHSRNTYLRAEMERLSEEVVNLRMLVGVECGCEDEVLAANLRERLSGDVELGADGVEEVVQRFLKLRSQGGVVPVGAWEGMDMERLAGLSSIGTSSRSESVMDEVFSPLGEDKMEDGGDSSESSPIELSEAEKLNYLVI